MLICHYDNVVWKRIASPGRHGSPKRRRYTKSFWLCQNAGLCRPPEDLREGNDAQTAKVLLLYAHPESQDSVANRVLLEPALQLPNVTVHDLYAHYPDFFIDIAYEQDLLRQHEVIVFQHPLYTWSCPALLKEWLDRVLSRGFASGAGGNELAGKYWRSVITTGEPESAYRRDANRYPMNDILRPFELTAGMCRMHWMSPIIVYWARRQQPEELRSRALAYRDWLANPIAAGGVHGGI